MAAVAAIALPPAADASSRAPVVQEMIVGSGGLVMAARPVAAAAAVVRVGSRRCRVGAGTPLAALAGARPRGPAFALRDYARCGSSPRDGAGLFVTTIAGQPNRGQDGWVYAVGPRVGTTGAGDFQSGPFGTGRRLVSGDRVLWFYCHMGRGGCQRRLDVTASGAPVAGSVTLAVTAYDDRGRGVPAAGSTVSLSSGATGTADATGRVTLPAPATGTAVAQATEAGLVPSLPVAVA